MLNSLTNKLARQINRKLPKLAIGDYSKMIGMTDLEYQSCINTLGLLEGEKLLLQYTVFRETFSTDIFGKPTTDSRKGLLVFTNDNMIFMQQEGAWSTDYSQALRIPLEEISGVDSTGTIFKKLRIAVGVSGHIDYHIFMIFAGQGTPVEIRASIDKILKQVRQERKRIAQEALAKETTPVMIFCRYCGARNRADQSNCANCGAVLT
jgi:hypothetical protein